MGGGVCVGGAHLRGSASAAALPVPVGARLSMIDPCAASRRCGSEWAKSTDWHQHQQERAPPSSEAQRSGGGWSERGRRFEWARGGGANKKVKQGFGARSDDAFGVPSD